MKKYNGLFVARQYPSKFCGYVAGGGGLLQPRRGGVLAVADCLEPWGQGELAGAGRGRGGVHGLRLPSPLEVKRLAVGEGRRVVVGVQEIGELSGRCAPTGRPQFCRGIFICRFGALAAIAG